jgi:hypothetical protein
VLGLRADPIYFELLDVQGNAVFRAAEVLRMLSLDAPRVDMYVAHIDQVANDSMEAANQLLLKVETSFITPLDKEDLCRFTRSLQTIVDQMSDIAKMIQALSMTKPSEDFQRITELLVELGGYLKEAVSTVRNRSKRYEIEELIRRIHRLKPDITHQCFRTIAEMIGNRNKQRLKWGLLLERLDRCLDQILQATHLIEIITIKYA